MLCVPFFGMFSLYSERALPKVKLNLPTTPPIRDFETVLANAQFLLTGAVFRSIIPFIGNAARQIAPLKGCGSFGVAGK
ncbi:MAG: hypothetical protein CSA68_03080 [Rhodobacterales bacterium]|nr:MAG: hypothetical protein CSA68_03080 [Rhodobacterales bacterium]